MVLYLLVVFNLAINIYSFASNYWLYTIEPSPNTDNAMSINKSTFQVYHLGYWKCCRRNYSQDIDTFLNKDIFAKSYLITAIDCSSANTFKNPFLDFQDLHISGPRTLKIIAKLYRAIAYHITSIIVCAIGIWFTITGDDRNSTKAFMCAICYLFAVIQFGLTVEQEMLPRQHRPSSGHDHDYVYFYGHTLCAAVVTFICSAVIATLQITVYFRRSSDVSTVHSMIPGLSEKIRGHVQKRLTQQLAVRQFSYASRQSSDADVQCDHFKVSYRLDQDEPSKLSRQHRMTVSIQPTSVRRRTGKRGLVLGAIEYNNQHYCIGGVRSTNVDNINQMDNKSSGVQPQPK